MILPLDPILELVRRRSLIPRSETSSSTMKPTQVSFVPQSLGLD